MDLKQQYPRTSSFNQLKNPLNINSLIFSGHAYCLMNLRNCPMEITLSSTNFFSSCTIIIKLLKFLSFGERYCEGR